MPRVGRTITAALRLQWREAPVASATSYVLAAVAGLAAAATGWWMRELIDELAAGPGGSAQRAVALVAAAAATTGAAVAIGHLNVYLNDAVRWRVTVAVERTLFAKVTGLSGLRELESPAFQGELRLAQQAALEAPQQLSHLLLAMITAATAITSSIALVWLFMPAFAWILLVAASVELATQLYCSRREAALTEALVQTHRWRDHHRALLLDLQAAKEIRLYGLGAILLDRLLGTLRRAAGRELALSRRTTGIRAGLALMSALVAIGGAIGVVRGTFDGRFQIGDVALFLAAVAGVQAAASALFWELAGAARSVMIFEHYLAIVELPEPAPAPTGAAEVPPLRDAIELRDAWFRYGPDAPWVLRGVDLRIPAGSTLGLVGVNGAGKSTLVKLLCRFWELERGAILWDGVDVRDLDVAALRRRIAATFQDFMAYDATAADNIGFGDVRHLADRTRIRRIADLSEIGDTLTALPDGYDTLLSRTMEPGLEVDHAASGPGTTLSGGQWQRVALARSLFRPDADLLILDEPSSGLDAGAEFRLNQAIALHAAGKTSVLISHRLSALRDADRIAVLRDGAIVEQGSHEELMAQGGAYAELFGLQARGYHDRRLAAVEAIAG
jgi:ATP-binding cassette, subfamily B, bacterial